VKEFLRPKSKSVLKEIGHTIRLGGQVYAVEALPDRARILMLRTGDSLHTILGWPEPRQPWPVVLMRSQLSEIEVLHLIFDVASQLERAHWHRTLHCDIRPSNVCFCGNDTRVVERWKLIDWSNARDLPVGASTLEM